MQCTWAMIMKQLMVNMKAVTGSNLVWKRMCKQHLWLDRSFKNKQTDGARPQAMTIYIKSLDIWG
jgi:hypothetical protein